MKLTNKIAIGAGLAAGLALAPIGSAYAGAIAFTNMLTTDTMFVDTATMTELIEGTDVIVSSHTTSALHIASIDVTGVDAEIGSALAPGTPVDALQACVGAGCAGIGENDFTQQVAGASFARSDSNFTSSLSPANPGSIDLLADGTGAGNLNDADVLTVAEGVINETSIGSSSTTVTGDNTVTIGLSVGGMGATRDVTFIGSLIAFAYAECTADVATCTASATSTLTIKIDDLDAGTNIFGGPLGSTIGTVSAATGVPGDINTASLPLGPFAIALTVPTDTNLQVTIRQVSSQQTSVVPTPATLGLLGTGLLAMAGIARRRNKKIEA